MILVDRLLTEFVDTLNKRGIKPPQTDQEIFEIKDIFFGMAEDLIANRNFLDSIVINDNIRPDIRNIIDKKIFGTPVFFNCNSSLFLFLNVDRDENKFRSLSSTLKPNFEESAVVPIQFTRRGVERRRVSRAQSYNPASFQASFNVDENGFGIGKVYYYSILGSITDLGRTSLAIMAEDFSRPDIWGVTPRGRGIHYVIQAIFNRSLNVIRDVQDILRQYGIQLGFSFSGGTAIIPHLGGKNTYSWIPNDWPIESGIWKFNAKPLTRPECFRRSLKAFVITAGFPFRFSITVKGK